MDLKLINKEVNNLNSLKEESFKLAKSLFENITDLIQNKYFPITIKLFEEFSYFVYFFQESYLSVLKLQLYLSIKQNIDCFDVLQKIKIIYDKLGLNFEKLQDYTKILSASSIFSSAFYNDIKDPFLIKSILQLIYQEFTGSLKINSLIDFMKNADDEIFLLSFQYVQFKITSDENLTFDKFLINGAFLKPDYNPNYIPLQHIQTKYSIKCLVKPPFLIRKIDKVLNRELSTALRTKKIIKIKNMKVSSVRCFEFKYLKRENIDKAIIRKFFKLLKNTSCDSTKREGILNEFTISKLLPPFKYKSIEFKTVNTSYLVWLFSHAEIREEYQKVSHLLVDNLLDTITNEEHFNHDKEVVKIYVNLLPQVYMKDSTFNI